MRQTPCSSDCTKTASLYRYTGSCTGTRPTKLQTRGSGRAVCGSVPVQARWLYRYNHQPLYRYKASLVPVQALLQATRELSKNSDFGILVPSPTPTSSGCVPGVGTLSTTLQKLWKGSTYRSNTRILRFAKIQCITFTPPKKEFRPQNSK